jgi:hypothetical protein
VSAGGATCVISMETWAPASLGRVWLAVSV